MGLEYKKNESFLYPCLSEYDFGIFRIIGPGLGNSLFPWARAVLAANRMGLKLIFPTWLNISIGPYIRGQTDKRSYHNLFAPSKKYIFGLKKYLILLTICKSAETNIDREKESKGNFIYIFKGMGQQFEDIYLHHKLIQKELLEIVNKSNKHILEKDKSPTIAVHIRRGDFSPFNKEQLIKGASSYCIPLEWYVSVISKLRKIMPNIPITIFSDGKEEELTDVLSLNNIKLALKRTSLVDMIQMSRAKLLVTSASTFSRWASYLGRMPVIWYPGQLINKLYYEKDGYEIECASNQQFPENFNNILKKEFGIE